MRPCTTSLLSSSAPSLLRVWLSWLGAALLVASAATAQSHLGKEFWLVDFPTPIPGFDIVIANPGPYQANVTIFNAIEGTTNAGLSAGTTMTFSFPEHEIPNYGTTLSTDPVYRITSDRKISVVVFESKTPAFLNEAYLSFPVQSLGKEYRVGSWFQTYSLAPCLIAVATAPGTTNVQFIDSAEVVQENVSLSQGQCIQRKWFPDMTGWRVVADKNVAVIAGNEGDEVGLCCFEAFIEQMIPEPRLASEYAVAPLLIRPIGCAIPSACSPDLFRFVATQNATTITTTPNVGGGLLNEGDYLEFTTSTPFVVQGDKPFAAYQYLISTDTLIGSSPAPDIGDPSLLDILPVEMYRKSYLFEAPPFVYDYLNVIAPVGTALVLDSAPISPTWTTVGTLNSVVYQCTQILVAPGAHELHSTNHAFSLTVTGIETMTASTFVAGFGEDCMPGGGWIRDTDDDDGGEPNPTSSAIWDSPDIWVRQQQDTALQFAHQHQAPLPNSVNYVYVKLRNMGCTPLAAGQLLTYFSKATTVNSWPSAWIGDPLNGDVIGSLPTPTIPVGGEVVLEFPWTPLLSGPSGILARFVSSADPMAFPEVSNVHTNAKNNNNIALKNLSVIGPAEIAVAGGPVVDFVLHIGNVDSFPTSFELQFGAPEASPDTAFLAQGSVLLTLPDELFAAWELAGGVAHGLELLPGTTTFELRAPNARLAGLPLAPGEERALTLNFLQTRRQALERRPCDPLVVRQHDMGTGTLEGGFTFAFALPQPGKRRAH